MVNEPMFQVGDVVCVVATNRWHGYWKDKNNMEITAMSPSSSTDGWVLHIKDGHSVHELWCKLVHKGQGPW